MKVQIYDINMFTCLCQEIVGEGKPDALHESFKLKTEKMSNIWKELSIYEPGLKYLLTWNLFSP